MSAGPSTLVMGWFPHSALPQPVPQHWQTRNHGCYHLPLSPDRRELAFLLSLWVFWNVLSDNWWARPILLGFPLIFTVYQRSRCQRLTLTSTQSCSFISYPMSNQEKQKERKQRAVKGKKLKLRMRGNECHTRAVGAVPSLVGATV